MASIQSPQTTDTSSSAFHCLTSIDSHIPSFLQIHVTQLPSSDLAHKQTLQKLSQVSHSSSNNRRNATHCAKHAVCRVYVAFFSHTLQTFWFTHKSSFKLSVKVNAALVGDTKDMPMFRHLFQNGIAHKGGKDLTNRAYKLKDIPLQA